MKNLEIIHHDNTKTESHFNQVNDFPKKGIKYIDCQEWYIEQMQDDLDKFPKFKKETVFYGIEARGFILATALALKNGSSLGMIRKKGKMPNPTHSVSYLTEYSTDEMEVDTSYFEKKKFDAVICDDVIATGGTIKAAQKMLQKHFNKVDLISIINIESLNQNLDLGWSLYIAKLKCDKYYLYENTQTDDLQSCGIR